MYRSWFHNDGTLWSFTEVIPAGVTFRVGHNYAGTTKVRVAGPAIDKLELLAYDNYCL